MLLPWMSERRSSWRENVVRRWCLLLTFSYYAGSRGRARRTRRRRSAWRTPGNKTQEYLAYPARRWRTVLLGETPRAIHGSRRPYQRRWRLKAATYSRSVLYLFFRRGTTTDDGRVGVGRIGKGGGRGEGRQSGRGRKGGEGEVARPRRRPSAGSGLAPNDARELSEDRARVVAVAALRTKTSSGAVGRADAGQTRRSLLLPIAVSVSSPS